MEDNKLPQLSAEEIRVLGALIEKSRTTPDYYPLTLNSLITACNQKSARNPIVEYEQDTVLEAIDGLKKKSLLANVLGDGRAVKYRHAIAVKYPLDPAEMTVLGLLFLRGPLTVGEIKNMAGRMYDYEDLEEVQKVLTALSSSDLPFVAQMERKSGQKEARYYHLFADVPEFLEATSQSANPGKIQELEERIDTLETQVAALKRVLDELMS
jgi:uncharacterized protein YceH (UPF0502 family)